MNINLFIFNYYKSNSSAAFKPCTSEYNGSISRSILITLIKTQILLLHLLFLFLEISMLIACLNGDYAIVEFVSLYL
jgi:hypothetical protein